MTRERATSPVGFTSAYRLREHAATIAGLPAPPETFVGGADVEGAVVTQLYAFDLIEKLERVDPSDADRHRWRLLPGVHERAVEYLERRDTFACCDSTGFTNDAGTLRCKECGTELSREEVVEVTSE